MVKVSRSEKKHIWSMGDEYVCVCDSGTVYCRWEEASTYCHSYVSPNLTMWTTQKNILNKRVGENVHQEGHVRLQWPTAHGTHSLATLIIQRTNYYIQIEEKKNGTWMFRVLLVWADSLARRGRAERSTESSTGASAIGSVINHDRDTLAAPCLPPPPTHSLFTLTHTSPSFPFFPFLALYLNERCEGARSSKAVWRWHGTRRSSLRLEWLPREQRRMSRVISIFT